MLGRMVYVHDTSVNVVMGIWTYAWRIRFGGEMVAIGGGLPRSAPRSRAIDVIGNRMTEINVTSPTGIQEIDRFDGVSLEADIWDAIEARHAAVHKA